MEIYTEAPVVAYHPPTLHRPSATVEVVCPFGCLELTPTGRAKKHAGPRRHVHGIGAAGSRPATGSRLAHCAGNPGRSYTITDPEGLVPDVLEIEPALSLAAADLEEARRRLARVQPARDLPWLGRGGATEVTK